MAKSKITVLQIGQDNWEDNLPENSSLNWEQITTADLNDFITSYLTKKEENRVLDKMIKSASEDTKEKNADYIEALKNQRHRLSKYSGFVLTDSSYEPEILYFIEKLISPHIAFYPDYDNLSEDMERFIKRNFIQRFKISEKKDFLYKLEKILFKSQEGSKLHINQFGVHQKYKANVSYKGHSQLILEGDFGPEYTNIGSYIYNISYDKKFMLDLWQEFSLDPTCKIKLGISLIESGSLSHVIKTWEVEGEDFDQQFLIDHHTSGYLAISVFAKGHGRIKLGPLHYRKSRGGYGEFVLGGKRHADSQRREFNYFFDPGDFKPPLTVYFSGWRSAEGFEGYGIMKSLGTPFLLFADPRLVGGSFYMGSESFERRIADIVRETLDYLGFDNSQLMLSGMSMGTFGALYYGSELAPHAIVISKPVLSIGDVALGERLNRPEGFPSSLDHLQAFMGELSEEAAEDLNHRFWRKFNKADFSKTLCAVAYMRQDDYDHTAFEKLVKQGSENGLKVIGRGWEGRHTDGPVAPVQWFMNQYHSILEKDFGRKMNDI